MDPVQLSNQIRALQGELNRHAWVSPAEVAVPDLIAETIAKIYELREPRALKAGLLKYGRTRPKRKSLPPRAHRTRKDPFERTWPTVKARLEFDRTRTANDLMVELIAEYPDMHNLNQRRTLHCRVLEWRQQQFELESIHRRLSLDPQESIAIFTNLAEIAAQI